MRDTFALLVLACAYPTIMWFFSTLIEVFWYDIFRSLSGSFSCNEKKGIFWDSCELFYVYRKRNDLWFTELNTKLHGFWNEYQSCTNKKPLTTNLLRSSIHKLCRVFRQRFSSPSILPLYASYIIQCFFMFRILFFYKRLLSRPIARISLSDGAALFFFSSLTNLIIFAWLLIYSFSSSFLLLVSFLLSGRNLVLISIFVVLLCFFFSFIFAFSLPSDGKKEHFSWGSERGRKIWF